MSFLPNKKAAKIIGVHPNTLRNWDRQGQIQTIRTDAGQRLYNVNEYIKKQECKHKLKCQETNITICYARVSSNRQKNDLQRQKQFLQQKYPNAKIVEEIGSGLNYERRGLRSILEQALSGISITLVITHKDRLARFGFELIQYIIERSGGKILVLNNDKLSPQQELTEDMLSIIHSFSSRLYGKRKYKQLEV